MEKTKEILIENDLLVNWLYGLLKKHPFKATDKLHFWTFCIYGHLFKIISETQKLNIGLFNDADTDNVKIRFIFDSFTIPKKQIESFEYSKENTNNSEIIIDVEEDKQLSNDEDEPVTNSRYRHTHFAEDFKNAALDLQNEEKQDDEVIDIKEEFEKSKNDSFDPMAYSNRIIENFVEKHKQPDSENQ